MLKNKRNITIFLVVILVVSGGIVFVYNRFIKDAPYRKYLSQADKQIEEQEYVEAALSLEEARKIKITEELTERTNLVSLCISQSKLLENASKSMEEEQYMEAMEQLSNINPKAVPVKKEADEKIQQCKNEIIKNNSNAIINYISDNEFDEAYSTLDKIIKLDPKNDKIETLKKQIEDKKTAYETEEKNLAVDTKEKDNKINQSADNNTKITADEAVTIAKNAYETATGDYSHEFGGAVLQDKDNVGQCYEVAVYDRSASGQWVDKGCYVLVKPDTGDIHISTSGEGIKTLEEYKNYINK